MAKFIVTGIPAFNGEYPIETGSFTMRELQIIKRMSGVRAGELEEAFEVGDSDVILAVAVIAVRRNGKAWEQFEALAWESDLGGLTFVADEAEVAPDAVPLTSMPLAPPATLDAPPGSSGQSSSTDGDDPQETNLRAIGSQA